MLHSLIAVAAAAAQTASPQAGAKWVPLNQAHATATAPTIAPAAPQAVILGPPAGSVLRAGTEVPLRLEEALNSNDRSLHEGQQFRMSVANPVMLGNVVVIPAGSPAIGEITDIRRKGMWGKSGHLNARALNVRVGDRLIRLSGTFDERGSAGTAAVVTSIVLLPIAGFFTTGTSAKIAPGSGVRAFLDEDLTIAAPLPVQPASAPLTVQAPPTMSPSH